MGGCISEVIQEDFSKPPLHTEHIVFRLESQKNNIESQEQIMDLCLQLTLNNLITLEAQFHNCSLSPTACIKLSQILSACKRLNSLTISQVFLNRTLEEVTQGIDYLSESFQSLCFLDSLYLQDNKFGYDGYSVLYHNLLACQSLKVLNLSRTNMTPDATRVLSLSLQQINNLSLEVFEAAGNPIQDEGCAYLAECFEELTTLRSIDLSSCSLTSVGTCQVLKSLKVNNQLVFLSFEYNDLSDESIGNDFQSFIQSQKYLGVLLLNYCQLGNKVGQILLQTLCTFKPHLSKLRLGCNELHGEEMVQLLMCLGERVTSINCIDLRGNLFDNRQKQQLLNTYDQLKKGSCLKIRSTQTFTYSEYS